MRLLERELQMESLDSALEHVVQHRGRIVLVSGEAGIGKTSLLREFADHAEGARILWGGCEALFTPCPLAPLHDIARQIGGDFPAVLAAASDRQSTFNASYEQLADSIEPTVVIIEDMHWADEATLDFVKFLGRRLRELSLMLVISYRDDEVSAPHPLRSVIGDLPLALVSRIQLLPLSEKAVESLARAADRPAGGLHEVTGGNAFYVTEVLASAQANIPASVRDAAIARTARLSDAARRVAHLVSLVPGKAESWLVDQTVAPDNTTLHECLNSGMVIFPDHSLGFRHELARLAVADNMSLTERRQLNATILATLQQQGEDKVATGRLVHHADQAADSQAVLRLAPAAAQRASAVGSHREAAQYLETALRHGEALSDVERARLLAKLSYECYLTDHLAESIRTRGQSLALWRSLGARLEEGDSLRWLSRLAWFNGQKAEAEANAVEAVEVLESLPHGRELAMAYSNRSQLHMLADEMGPALAWGQKALDLAITLGETEIRAHALINIGTAKMIGGDAAGRQDLELALQIALQHGFHEHVARAYTNLSSNLIRSLGFAAAAPILASGITFCEERDLDSMMLYLKARRAENLLALGRWHDAARDADAIISHAGVAPVTRIPALVVLGRLKARRGEPDVEAPLAEAHGLAVHTGELQRLGPVLTAQAEAAWLHGSATEAFLAELTQAYQVGLKGADVWRRSELAYWLWRHGRPVGIQATHPDPYASQIAGDWQAAAAMWEQIGCPYEQAQALADADMEAPLRRALEISVRLGADTLTAMVRRKLRTIGVRGIPRGAQDHTRQNPAGMTRQELKVLAMLMEGRRNADIARSLFISEKTVGNHVSSLLAKLGVRSRGEAAATAKAMGLDIPTPSGTGGKHKA